jgi:flagellar motor switch protein FliG
VLTLYGKDDSITNISVGLFDSRSYSDKNNAELYCDNINELKLLDNEWIYASIINENEKISLENLRSSFDMNIFLLLDDLAIQMVIRKSWEIDKKELSKALKGTSDAIQDAVFRNMTKIAAKLLKEDMDFMGPIRLIDVEQSQRKVVEIIKHLEKTGEIKISKTNISKEKNDEQT